jgi:spermidine synthase
MSEPEKQEVQRFPNLIVFISSFCLMVLELIAGRLMAPYLGVSLYTWTSIIGIILAGISLGNYFGGRAADSKLSKKTLGSFFLLAGASSVSVLYLVPAVGSLLGGMNIPLAFATFIFSIIIFFPASFFLGCISPMVVKFDLKNLEQTGRTVGRIYAFGSLGSILGTFATGFLFIAYLGTKFVVIGVAAILILLGLLIIGSPKKNIGNRINIVFGLIFLGSFWIPGNCARETNYYCISTRPVVAEDRTHGLILKLDHLIHSFVYPGREDILTYEYEKLYKFLTDYWIADSGREDFGAFFLGGGGYTLPRYFEKFYPAGSLEVSEIDPGVTRFNFEKLSLNPDTKIKSINRDARIFLQQLPEDKKYDLIFGDAFNDFAVPYHLTTLEFDRVIKDHLASGGFYAVNVIDDYQHGQFVSSFVKTLGGVFSHVYLAPLSSDWEKSKRNTFVILAGEEEIDPGRWNRVLKKLESDGKYNDMDKVSFLVPKDKTQQFTEDKKAVVLTDNYVPVDNLLAPLFNYDY